MSSSIEGALESQPETKRNVSIQPITGTTHSTGITTHGAGETQWWFDGRGSDDPLLRASAERSNCTHIVLNLDQYKKTKTSKKKWFG